MNYVYEHEIEPYNKLLIKLTIKDNRLIAEKKHVLGVKSDLVHKEATTFGDMVWIVSDHTELNSFEFPNVIILDAEMEFFEGWKKLNNLSGNEKKLWRERT